MNDIKTIDIQGKTWLDKPNGNSYFSTRTIIDFGFDTERTIYTPFQYGYGDQYIFESFKTLKDLGIITIGDKDVYWSFCKDHEIILRYHIESHSRPQVERWGEKS